MASKLIQEWNILFWNWGNSCSIIDPDNESYFLLQRFEMR